MARIRTIKPEFFTSEDIVSMSPLARLLYIALWCEADKEGRLNWKPKTFKMRYLPADTCNIEKLCQELIDSGVVVLYGNGLAYIPGFLKHQHINPRESKSELPEPLVSDASARVGDASARVGTREHQELHCAIPDVHAQGGREGKGREGNARDATPDGVSDSVWHDFQKLRKAKRAPVTDTVIEGIKAEADKAGISLGDALAMCCKRGWQGFEAAWVTSSDHAKQSQFAGAI